LGDRLHHAFLFTGTRGVGKTTSARILAKTLNCKEGNILIPCGVCTSCEEIIRGTSLDVLEIDGASNNTVEKIREIIEQVKYPPMYGKYRIIVIDEVHMLTKSAFNALLKTLEEPPRHALFIFATTEIDKVPQTILSRVLRFDFKRISNQKIVERLQYVCLQEEIQFEEAVLWLIAEKADGSMRDALTFFDQIYSFAGKDFKKEDAERILGLPPEHLYTELFTAIAAHNAQGCLESMAQFELLGVEIESLVQGLSKYLRNLYFARLEKSTALQLGVSESSLLSLKTLAQEFEQGDLLRFSKITSELQNSLKNAPYPRIAVEMALSRMAWLDRVSSLRQLLVQVSEGRIQPDDIKKKTLNPA
jgi:DNA polymerase III subunit gamma/tau